MIQNELKNDAGLNWTQTDLMKWHWMIHVPTMNQIFQPLLLPSSYWSTPPALVSLVPRYPCRLFSQKCNWPCPGKSERSPSLFHHWQAKIYFKTELSHHWLPEIFQDWVSKGTAWEESFISEITTDTGNEAKKKKHQRETISYEL